jgi:peptidoglycan/LPS O-acetylase OafA/YrhL
VRPLGYRPGLDGVRGIAILLVVSWHAFGWPAGGAAGVDLFFVLSGFLITTLLLQEHGRTGTMSLRRFYRRRALRLFPALAALLVICAAVTALVDREHLPSMLHSIALTAVYSINLATAGHWFLSGTLAHMWSLAAEEQFYLVWPIVLLLLVRRRSRLSIGLLCALIALAVAWRGAIALDGASFARVYYAPDTHADPLLIGCLFGVLFTRDQLPKFLTKEKSRRRLATLAVIAIGIIVFGVTSLWTLYATPLITLLALAAGVVVLSVCLDERGALAAVLRARPLAWLGRVSYSLYLWHLPVLVALGYLPGAHTGRPIAGPAAAIVVALVVAAASYRFIEQPFLRRKNQPQQAERAPVAAMAGSA